MSISEVAERSGFACESTFRAIFISREGRPPEVFPHFLTFSALRASAQMKQSAAVREDRRASSAHEALSTRQPFFFSKSFMKETSASTPSIGKAL